LFRRYCINPKIITGSKKATSSQITSINSLGTRVKGESILSKFPYKVDRCDQIVAVQAKIIPDHDDYTKRTEALVTITAYHLNVFKNTNADTLLHSILFSETKELPMPLRGARGCIKIDGGKSGHGLAVCLENEKDQENILGVLKKFSDCRGDLGKVVLGDDLEKIRKLLRGCGISSFKNAKELQKKLDEMKNRKPIDLLAQRPGFFHPGGDKVPGT